MYCQIFKVFEDLFSESSNQMFSIKTTQKPLITIDLKKRPLQKQKKTNVIFTIEVKKKKFSSHWLIAWLLTLFNFWDCIIDFRGTGLAYFLFSKKRIIKRNKLQDKGNHIVVSISSLLSQKTLSPYIEINKNLVKKKYLQNLKELKKKKKINYDSTNCKVDRKNLANR